jgi:hypothetical protein
MKRFIPLTVTNHAILHGFDENNKEILEQVVSEPSTKLVQVDRILSVSEKYVLISYAFDRIIYWEYLDGYEKVKAMLGW